MNNNLTHLVQKLLKKNAIHFDHSELDFQIQSHPSYPSLHAITGVLDHFNIENVAAEVPVDQETLVQLPDYFIAQINTEKGQDLIHVERKQEHYLITNTHNQENKHTENEFLTLFTGILIVVEAPETGISNTKKISLTPYLVAGLLISLI